MRRYWSVSVNHTFDIAQRHDIFIFVSPKEAANTRKIIIK